MAIARPLAEFLCAEHRWRPLPKTILLLGRQTMPFQEEALREIASKRGPSVGPVELDDKRIDERQNADQRWISDTTFFGMLGVETIHALDHSDFEGADIVHDICPPIPAPLEGRFDFIFNGSVLDNVFDTTTALRNIGRLLAPGGRAVHVETATGFRYSYSALSPSWFFDWAVVNRYDDCKVYMGAVGDAAGLTSGRWAMLGFDPTAEPRPNDFTCDFGAQLGVQMVLFEKGAASTSDATPAQAHYRSDADWDTFIERAEPLRVSSRPIYLGDGGTGEPIASFQGV